MFSITRGSYLPVNGPALYSFYAFGTILLICHAHIIISLACTPVTGLCGKILTLVRELSSLTCTSSAVQVISVILTQLPIVFLRPMIELLMQLQGLITVLLSTVESLILTPSPMTQPSPITTLGPSCADSLTYAVSCTKIPEFWKPVIKLDYAEVVVIFFSIQALMQSPWPIRQSVGYPMSIQQPGNSIWYSWPSLAIAGKISRSIEVGRFSIRSMMSKLKRYRPALILLLTKVCGFSTKRSIYPSS